MGYKCPHCGKDFGLDKEALYNHFDFDMRRKIEKCILSNKELVDYACVFGNEDTHIESDIAKFAILCADALINELKKNKRINENNNSI